MIEQIVTTKASREKVWQAWHKAHSMDQGFEPGKKGVLKTSGGGTFKYLILDVQQGESFTIRWKTLFVRLLFTQAVAERGGGSEIRYSVEIRGLFAWAVRKLLAKKIKRNLSLVLKALVYQLETGA